MTNKLITVTSIFMALLMLVFGLNKFIGFIPVDPPADPIAQQFLGAMFSSYLFVVVALAEIMGGIFLLFAKTRFTGWLILSPIVFNIVAFHVAHDFIGNGIWIVPSTLFVLIGYFYKNRIKELIK